MPILPTRPPPAATNLMFMLLVGMGPHLNMLIVTISCDNFSAGLATSAFVAYLSSLTNLKFSATPVRPAQFHHAAAAAPDRWLFRRDGGKPGYAHFFLATALMGIPTLLLIIIQWRCDKRQAA